jgi:hypothetical protein
MFHELLDIATESRSDSNGGIILREIGTYDPGVLKPSCSSDFATAPYLFISLLALCIAALHLLERNLLRLPCMGKDDVRWEIPLHKFY